MAKLTKSEIVNKVLAACSKSSKAFKIAVEQGNNCDSVELAKAIKTTKLYEADVKTWVDTSIAEAVLGVKPAPVVEKPAVQTHRGGEYRSR